MFVGPEMSGAEFAGVGPEPPLPPPPPQANNKGMATHQDKASPKVLETGVVRTSFKSTIATIAQVVIPSIHDNTANIQLEPIFLQKASADPTYRLKTGSAPSCFIDEETSWRANPEVAPDGRRVLYSSYQGRQWHQLWVSTLKVEAALSLTFGEFDVTQARWSASMLARFALIVGTVTIVDATPRFPASIVDAHRNRIVAAIPKA